MSIQLNNTSTENDVSVTETTRRQKAVRAFKGLSPRIKTFAIITAENPMGRELSSEENQERNMQLVSDMRKMHFRYFPIHGSYAGNVEKPFMIFNIGLEDAKFLSHKYDQEAFILATVLDRGHVIFKYYQKNFSAKTMAQRGWGEPPYPEKADYQLRDTSKKVDMLDSATKDGYSGIYKKFKYTIPFSIFQEFDETLEERCALFEDYQECLNDRIQLGIDGGGARNRMHYRASIYGDNFHRFWNVPRNPEPGTVQEDLVNRWKELASQTV